MEFDFIAAIDVATKVVAAAAAIASLTPTPKDDGILLIVRKVVDFFAFNFGHAKNGK